MESVCWGNSTVGSNPTLSAMHRTVHGSAASRTTVANTGIRAAAALACGFPSTLTTGDGKQVWEIARSGGPGLEQGGGVPGQMPRCQSSGMSVYLTNPVIGLRPR